MSAPCEAPEELQARRQKHAPTLPVTPPALGTLRGSFRLPPPSVGVVYNDEHDTPAPPAPNPQHTYTAVIVRTIAVRSRGLFSFLSSLHVGTDGFSTSTGSRTDYVNTPVDAALYLVPSIMPPARKIAKSRLNSHRINYQEASSVREARTQPVQVLGRKDFTRRRRKNVQTRDEAMAGNVYYQRTSLQLTKRVLGLPYSLQKALGSLEVLGLYPRFNNAAAFHEDLGSGTAHDSVGIEDYDAGEIDKERDPDDPLSSAMYNHYKAESS